MKYGFNNQIKVYDPGLDEMKIRNMGYTPCTLDEVLEQSDFISLHCSLNETTRHMIDTEQLKKMKKSAILINTARGAVVNEPAVAEAVKNGEIFGYGADATETEPVDPEHPMMKLKNVVVTPHSAIYNRTCMYNMNRKVMKDIFLVAAGEKPVGIVEQ